MKTIISTILVAIALGGCAHKELKAPCANIAALNSSSIPCDQREPVNTKIVPSTFAQ